MMLAPGALALLLLAATSPADAKDGKDLVSFGNDVVVREGQEVTGDLVVFGGNAKVYGHVDGDAAVMGGDLYIAPSGEVDGSTVAFGGSVDNESSSANSGSGHHHMRANPVPPVPVAPVPPVPDNADNSNTDNGPPTAWYTLLAVLGILSLLAFAIAPGTVRMLRDELVRRPVLGTVVGFSWPFILVVVMIALTITVIGIVLMPAVVVAVVVAYLVGRATVAQLLGRRLFDVANAVEPSPLATAAVGLVIITAVEALLPLWMGIGLEACVSCVALGAAMLPLLHPRQVASFAPAGYAPPPTPVFTPPSPPPHSGPPAVPQ
ncbi:MAG: hypothetical protein ACHQY2_05185 [Candidatus Eremiobacterales bacterium]